MDAPILLAFLENLGLQTAIPLLIIGFIFIMAEVFIPSGGALTVLAVLSLVASLISAFAAGETVGMVFLGITVVSTPMVIMGAIKIFPHTPFGKRMIVDAPNVPPEQRMAVAHEEKQLLGQIGTVKSMLRPAGTADIAGETRDVVTQGELIDAGKRIQVVEVEGNRIVVRAVN